VQSEEIYQTDT